MNFSDSDYFNSLPYGMQEQVLQSGIPFENEEEMTMFLSRESVDPMPKSFIFPYDYSIYYPGMFGPF